jgi:hypothetical protein
MIPQNQYSRIDPPHGRTQGNTGDTNVVVRYGIFTDWTTHRCDRRMYAMA